MQTNQEWLAAELDRVWLHVESALRAYQRAELRPRIAEVEAIFAARRRERGLFGEPDDAERQRALGEASDAARALRPRTPIGALTARLGLDALATETLVLALAPEIDPPLADAFAILRGTSRRDVDLALVAQLHRLERRERVALHGVLAPLVRWRLVDLGAGPTLERAIRPSADVLEIVHGALDLPASLGGRARLVAPGAAPIAAIDPAAEPMVTALRVIAREDGPHTLPRVVAWGPRGAGKRAVAQRIASAAGRAVLLLDLHGVEPAHQEELVRRAQREALRRDALLYLGRAGVEVARWLDGYPGPIVIGVESHEAPRLELEGPVHEIRLGAPDTATRRLLWEAAIPAYTRAAALDLAQIASAFRITAGEIAEVATEASVLARAHGGGVAAGDVRRALERRLRNDLGRLARRLDVTARWDDLVLPADDLDRLRELVARGRFAQQVYDQWGFGARVGYGKGLVALFSGPPGTGKTMLAGLIGRELGLDVYQVDLSQVFSKWVGETEKHLGTLFDEAERAHAVLLFDEADSLFGKRTETEGSNDRYANLAVNYLLQRLEAYSGVGVLTTNKEAALDPALARRLALHLRLAVPKLRERERLWRSMLPASAPLADDVDLHALAREFKLAGGNIKNVALRAAFLAADARRAIDHELLRRAAALELEDMGRIVSRRSDDNELDEEP